MFFDGHIHIGDGSQDIADFISKLDKAGMDGGILISLAPPSFPYINKSYTPDERLRNLKYWTESKPGLYPVYWIDPLEKNAFEQVDKAAEAGVNGFKVICNHFFCGEEKPMSVFRKIAEKNLPVMFHSGILWDGQNSSKYNRPENFEALIEIDKLKFSLAHVSWPWCDDCIAVYGKFLNSYAVRPDFSAEMFIDLTPGTPHIYRKEVLTKLYTIGYDVENNVFFGSDSKVNDYNFRWTKEWIARDNEIYDSIKLPLASREKIYSENLKRFLGLINLKIIKKPLKSGE